MNKNSTRIFQRYPKTTRAAILSACVLCTLGSTELALRYFLGFGRPALYYKDPAFGFRPQPNQVVRRNFGKRIRINNLGLRAQRDWDQKTDDKILFLGDSVTHGGNWISNANLFSQVALENLPGFQSGNAGVPNWGVENVCGLIVDHEFDHAKIYVSTFIEHDFYRGLESGDNKPWIWYESPRFAIYEMSHFVWYRYFRNPRNFHGKPLTNEENQTMLNRAADKLKGMDEQLKARGCLHLIFISPTVAQVLGHEERDPLVFQLLKKHQLDAIYLLDKLPQASREVKERWFQDDVHLTQLGHRTWGQLIGRVLQQHLGRRRAENAAGPYSRL